MNITGAIRVTNVTFKSLGQNSYFFKMYWKEFREAIVGMGLGDV